LVISANVYALQCKLKIRQWMTLSDVMADGLKLEKLRFRSWIQLPGKPYFMVGSLFEVKAAVVMVGNQWRIEGPGGSEESNMS